MSSQYLVKHKSAKFLYNAKIITFQWLHFMEPGVKVNDAYSLLSRQSSCQEATTRHIPDIPGWGFVFQQDGAPAHPARDTVAFLEGKVPDFIPPTLWPSPSRLY